MCGILGFNWRDEKLAEKLAESLAHRGPDQNGFYFDDGLSFGHRRLSIVDLSENGRQPMILADGSVSVVFNGEIFNFQELRQDLESKGCVFKSKSDTEVLLHGYKEYGGAGLLERLNGQFAFAIYDKGSKEIFLARDRAGINPLYYFFDGQKFIFGSELKVLMLSGIEKKINRQAFNYYCLFSHTPGRQSILENCFKLEAGKYLIFDLQTKSIKKEESYWRLSPRLEIKDEAEAKKKILEQLEKSVKARMVADVPVGAFLSGGLDSSAVVAMMSRHTANLNTFSVKFEHAEYDESPFAEKVSQLFGTKHHVIEFSAKDIKESVEKMSFFYDEPFGNPSALANLLVSRVARENVTVSLSGDGGDELFGGYGSYVFFNRLVKLRFIPRIFFKIIGNLPFVANNGKWGKFFEVLSLPVGEGFASLRAQLYKTEFRELTGENPDEYYRQYANGQSDPLSIDFENYLREDGLTKVDRASLANSLESRPPFLDHEMIKLAFSISSELKIKDGQSKYILKKALEGILPDEIIYRVKHGFSVPLKHYLRGELKDLVIRYVVNYDKHDLFSPAFIKRLAVAIEQESWDRNYSRPIWLVLMFNMWHERWIAS